MEDKIEEYKRIILDSLIKKGLITDEESEEKCLADYNVSGGEISTIEKSVQTKITTIDKTRDKIDDSESIISGSWYDNDDDYDFDDDEVEHIRETKKVLVGIVKDNNDKEKVTRKKLKTGFDKWVKSLETTGNRKESRGEENEIHDVIDEWQENVKTHKKNVNAVTVVNGTIWDIDFKKQYLKDFTIFEGNINDLKQTIRKGK